MVRSVILDDFDLNQAVVLLRDQIWARLGYTEASRRADAPVAASA